MLFDKQLQYKIYGGSFQKCHLLSSNDTSIMKLLLLALLSVVSAQDFDTIAFVQKWPMCRDKDTDCPIKGKMKLKISVPE